MVRVPGDLKLLHTNWGFVKHHRASRVLEQVRVRDELTGKGLAAANGRFVSVFVISGAGLVPSSVYATWRPTGGNTAHSGRTEVNRYVLRREIERRSERRRVVRKSP